jgi:hypothetical protein
MIRCGNPEHYHPVIGEDDPGYRAFADAHPQHHHTVGEVRACFASEMGLPSIEDEDERAAAEIERWRDRLAYPEAYSAPLPAHFYV